MATADITAPQRAARRVRTAHLRAMLGPSGKAIAVALLVVLITFALGKLVLGDPGRLVLGQTASEAAVQAFNANLGLNHPIVVQLLDYFQQVLSGNLGTSYAFTGTPVWSIVGPGLAISGSLAGITVVTSLVVAVPLGLLSAVSGRGWVDWVIRAAAVIALSTPSAFVGLVLILLIAVHAGVLPASGWGTTVADSGAYLVLPVATLTIYLAPILLRVVRERAHVVLEESHVEAALSRGIPMWRVLVSHVLPNCASPILVVLGFNVGSLLSGAVIVEVVFGLPGLGRVASAAAGSSDLPVLQGVALVAGILVTLANVLAELAQRLIDPRLRS